MAGIAMVMRVSVPIASHLTRIEAALYYPGFRLVLLGMGFVLLFGGTKELVRRVPNVVGRGIGHDIEELARKRYSGDVDRARSAIRAVIPSALTAMGTGVFGILLGWADPSDYQFRSALLWGFLGLEAVGGGWFAAEYWLAKPGILVPRQVRGTLGMRAVLRERDESH